MDPQFIEYYDYPLLLPYILIFFLLARRFAKKNAETQREFYWLLINWWLKMVACILYAWMIVYYYGYGDPLAFKMRGDPMYDAILDNWENLKYIVLPVGAFKDYLAAHGRTPYDLLYYTEANFMISRISCMVAFFTFNSYLLISFVFTNIAYYGFTLLYTASKKIIHGYNKALALGILFVPSGVYWSSSLAKEPICMICVGVMFTCLVKLVILKRKSMSTILKLAFYSAVVYIVKDYIFYCFAFSLVFWGLYSVLRKILQKSLFFKIVFGMMVFFAFGVAYYYSDMLTSVIRDNLGEVISMNVNMYEAMASVKEGGGSFIDIGQVDFSSIGGILKFVPQGLANVFFRPYPWEISNVLMILTVLENLFFILLFFRALYLSRLFTRGLHINRDYQVFALLFTLSMGFAIAISTFNFGSMVRYKMPFLPFWATFLLIINIKLSKKKATVNMPMPVSAVELA